MNPNAELLRARACAKKEELAKKIGYLLGQRDSIHESCRRDHLRVLLSDIDKLPALNEEIVMLEQHIAALQKFLNGELKLEDKKTLSDQEGALLRAEEGLREKRERVHKIICEIDLVNALIGG